LISRSVITIPEELDLSSLDMMLSTMLMYGWIHGSVDNRRAPFQAFEMVKGYIPSARESFVLCPACAACANFSQWLSNFIMCSAKDVTVVLQ